MTYQSASGAGAKQVRELIAQSAYISQHLSADELTSSGSVLPLVNKVSELINSAGMPVENFGVPLMGKHHSVDRQRSGRWKQPRRMEGRGGN